VPSPGSCRRGLHQPGIGNFPGWSKTAGIKKMKSGYIKCPTCKKEVRWENNPFRPFCSDRCRLIDLGKWASEDYRIPGEKRDSPGNDPDEKNNPKR
jgi:endogenous inhibitor of DNA gyrase (YacG/DUF329 family)